VSNNWLLERNIKNCKLYEKLVIATNGGDKNFSWLAELNILPLTVHYDEGSFATILSMKDVVNIPGASVKINSDVERAIFVYVNGSTFKFSQCPSGLFYLDTDNINKKEVNEYPDYRTN